MRRFAQLLDDLYFTNSTRAKEKILAAYLEESPDPDRGWALAAIAGTLKFDLFKRNLTKTLITERMDEELFALSYDYVGELSETVALAWPVNAPSTRPIASTARCASTPVRSKRSSPRRTFPKSVLTATGWPRLRCSAI